MTRRNSADAYGTVAKWLHWTVAALFLLQYVSAYYRQWFTVAKTEANLTALQIHLSVGATIFVLVALRIFWRLTNIQPTPEPGPRWQHRTASLWHLGLYAIMILMPITGYLGTGADIQLFGIPKFASTPLFQWLVVERLGMTFPEWEAPVDFIHKVVGGQYLVWMLIAGHVAAALYHHYRVKDRTLERMSPDGWVRRRATDAAE